MVDFAHARHNMVLSQLRPSGVRDERVTAAMAAVPREAFVAPHQQAIAYVDEDLPLGAGRYLMEPLVFGRLLVAAEVGPDDVVLDVGCASGYSAAVLARLAGTVVALEEDEGLADRADSALAALEVDNAAIMRRPLAGGYIEQGPYDVIVIEGAVPAVPDGIADQLREGGRLVAVVGNADIGRCVVVRRIGGLLSERITHDAAIPPLPGFARRAEFVF
jgi:protein-L-isoaspartate(D-aspartate) O-methyltransferase